MRYAGNELGGVLYVGGGFAIGQVNEVMFGSFFVIKLVVIISIIVKNASNSKFTILRVHAIIKAWLFFVLYPPLVC